MKTSRLIFTISGLFLCCISSATAQTLDGRLRLHEPEMYEGYAFVAYSVTAENGPLSVLVESADTDTYLILRSPEGVFHEADDTHGQNPEVVLQEAEQGVWLAVVTSYRPGLEGVFTITVRGASQVSRIDTSALPTDDTIPEAFASKGVENTLEERARRLELLSDQLTLSTFRSKLTAELQRSRDRLNHNADDQHNRFSQLEIRRSELQRALSEIDRLDSSKELVESVLNKELGQTKRQLSSVSSALEEIVSQREAYSIALMEIQRLDSIDVQLKRAMDSVITAEMDESLIEIRSGVVRLREERQRLTMNIARKLVDSSMLSMGSAPDDLLGTQLVNFSDAIRERVVAMAAAPETAHSREQQVDPWVWLPKLFPWPPPTPSSHVVFGNTVLKDWDDQFTTLGDINDALVRALSACGYSGPSYFGVPEGFALVTSLEQTNANGVPLQGTSRWSASIVAMKEFSLREYIRALLTAPPGYFRSIVFIVSTEPFTLDPDRARFSTIERWSQTGHVYLPEGVRTAPYTGNHRVSALIYEFRKRKNSDAPHTLVPGRHTAQQHLTRSRLLPSLR